VVAQLPHRANTNKAYANKDKVLNNYMYDPLLQTIAFHPSLALLRQESSSASNYNRKVFAEHCAAHAVACGGIIT